MIVCIRVPGDALHDTAWQELLDALDVVTPLIEDARVGTAFLDMHGADGDFLAWSRMIRTVLVPLHLRACIGAGPNRFCAFAAAWSGDGTVIVAGEEAAALEPMPLDVLELEAGVVQRLQLLGITTLGALSALPHGPFVRRFGPDAARWHNAARGVDRAPFVPRGHAITIEAAMLGEGSAQSEAAVIFALRVLLGRICSRSRALWQTCKRAASRNRTRERRHRARRPTTRCSDLARARDARRIARQTRRCELSCTDLRAAFACDGLRKWRRSRTAVRRRRDRSRKCGSRARAFGSDARRTGTSRTDLCGPSARRALSLRIRSPCPNAIRPAAPQPNRSSYRSCVSLPLPRSTCAYAAASRQRSAIARCGTSPVLGALKRAGSLRRLRVTNMTCNSIPGRSVVSIAKATAGICEVRMISFAFILNLQIPATGGPIGFADGGAERSEALLNKKGSPTATSRWGILRGSYD